MKFFSQRAQEKYKHDFYGFLKVGMMGSGEGQGSIVCHCGTIEEEVSKTSGNSHCEGSGSGHAIVSLSYEKYEFIVRDYLNI